MSQSLSNKGGHLVLAVCLLISSGGCSGDGFVAPKVNVGNVSISAITTGRHIDVDGYTLLIDGQALASFGSNGGALLQRVAAKTYLASLSGLAPNCRLVTGDTGRIKIKPNVTTVLGFQFACSDTERIAFVSEREGRPRIFVMELDGSGQTRLTFDANYNTDPTWSPDGNRIAFASSDGANQSNIVIAKVDRSGTRILGGDGAKDSYPAWSPDGSQIAFNSGRAGGADLFLVNVDGTNERRITDSPDLDFRPSWSPDGTSLVFDAAPPAPSLLFNVWSIKADGTAKTQLTDRSVVALNAQLSPDGTRVVFQSLAFASDVFVMNADGSGVAQITSDPADDKDPFWSADGSRIVFASNRSGNDEIYVMNADGTNVIRLTNSLGGDYDPVWSR